ncbi:MAG: S1 RNA-binding domain-containing protein [Erysipelotrichales bacterium]
MKNVVGSIYTGEVVLKEQNSYLLDLGIGFDAILTFEEAERELEIGDEADVIVTHFNKDDYYVSMRGVSRRRLIEDLEKLVDTDETIKGRVTGFRNKRFSIDLGSGVKGSVYVKNMDTKFINEGDEYLNKEYDFKIMKRATRGFEDFELNRRDLVAQENEEAKADFLSKFNLGDEVEGVVVEAINAGVILDVDGTKCFIPRSEISHLRSSALPEVGSKFKAVIEEVQERSLRLKGSIKKLIEHPFKQAKDIKVDDKLNGKVVRKSDYGLFVELFEGVDGLVHISEVSYEHTKNLDAFEVGQEVEVKVINIDHDKHKIGLSIKRLQPSPYQFLREKTNVGDTISVLIKRITENGVRVMVFDNFYTTIINEDIYDFSKIKPTLRINDRLEVIVTELDDENEKISLSNEEFVKQGYELLESSI